MASGTSEKKKKQEEQSDNRKTDVIKRRRPGTITDYRRDGRRFRFTGKNDIELQVEVKTDHIIRVRYLLDSDLHSDFSYALDPGFEADDADIRVKESDEFYQLSTGALACRITKERMKVHFYDAQGRVLCEDHHGFYRQESLMKGITKVEITKEAPGDVTYWGLGDKVPENNLRGNTFENWNTDSFEYERGDDPLYRSIPFYTALHNGRAYGIFLDNPYRSRFDFDSSQKNISSFSAEGGVMDYYFINGPGLTEVTERYTRLTGTPGMPPMWALGYHQCRWSYYPESRVRKLAETFRDKQIPCDALYLDIDYMDGYRVFTWNEEHFPDPASLIKDLKQQGFKTIVMIDPGIKADDDYFVYRQGKEKGFFCLRPDGDMLLAPVWPAQSAFPDFTRPAVRDWWAGLYEDQIAAQKVDGIWNDMNEPAVFEVKRKTFPDNIRHHYEGQPCSHKKAHNIYGMQMARASLQGIKQHNPEKRPFLLTRANFSGGQRYAALWTGDNIASWDHLKLANEQCQRLSISGYSFVGTDIGGFVDDPTPELFTRWLQLSVFHPLFRNHTMGFNVDGAAAVDEEEVEQQKKRKETADQEPWSFGKKYTAINRSVIELRYRLLHYLYTAFYRYTEHGTPILRPLAYCDPSDEKAVNQTDPFLFGDKILVSPVLKKGQTEVETYLPRGGWYDFRTHKKYGGRKSCSVAAPLGEIPFFVKAGTVLPLREVMQYTSERTPETLELNIYYAEGGSTSQFYEDAGEGHDYTKGDYRLTAFRLEGNADAQTLTMSAERKGRFKPGYREVNLTLIGLPFAPSSVMVDGDTVAFEEDPDSAPPVYRFPAASGFEEIEIC